jgi:hypothetical protein
MRFSVIALAGLAAFGEHLGAQARATPNGLALSTSIDARDDASLSVLEDLKRRLVSVLPRAPAVILPKPVAVPKPVEVAPPPRPGVADPAADGPPPAAKPGALSDKPDAPAAEPKPLKPADTDVNAGAVCKLPKTRRSSRLSRRAYTKADAGDPAKVLEWLNANEAYLAGKSNGGVHKDKLVFFASGTDKAGEDMANDFVDKNKGYGLFDDVFGSKFSKDFGGVAPRDGEAGKGTSKALALWSKNPIVFDYDKGKLSPSLSWRGNKMRQNCKLQRQV